MGHKYKVGKPVDWDKNVDDIECCILGLIGLSTKAIRRRTSLTASQITYRLHKAGVRRVDYRDGISEIAKLAVETLHKDTQAFFSQCVVPSVR